jgi:hypothetical protein
MKWRIVVLAAAACLLAPLVALFVHDANHCNGYKSVASHATRQDPTNLCGTFAPGDLVILILETDLVGEAYMRAQNQGLLQRRGLVDSVNQHYAVIAGETVACTDINHVYKKMTPFDCGASSVKDVVRLFTCLVMRNCF